MLYSVCLDRDDKATSQSTDLRGLLVKHFLPLTDHHVWNAAYPCPVAQIYIKKIFFYTSHSQHFQSCFGPFADNISLFFFFLKRVEGGFNHMVRFGYCQLVFKYLMSNVMKLYCLRVFRGDVRRTGKRSFCLDSKPMAI